MRRISKGLFILHTSLSFQTGFHFFHSMKKRNKKILKISSFRPQAHTGPGQIFGLRCFRLRRSGGLSDFNLLINLQDDISSGRTSVAYEGLALENKGRKSRWHWLRKPCLTILYSGSELVFGG
jgi:hypothetical protein